MLTEYRILDDWATIQLLRFAHRKRRHFCTNSLGSLTLGRRKQEIHQCMQSEMDKAWIRHFHLLPLDYLSGSGVRFGNILFPILELNIFISTAGALFMTNRISDRYTCSYAVEIWMEIAVRTLFEVARSFPWATHNWCHHPTPPGSNTRAWVKNVDLEWYINLVVRILMFEWTTMKTSVVDG